jgi:hypothetical protein
MTAQIAVPYDHVLAGRQGLGDAEFRLAHFLRAAHPIGRPFRVVGREEPDLLKVELLREIDGDGRLRIGEHIVRIRERLVECALGPRQRGRRCDQAEN